MRAVELEAGVKQKLFENHHVTAEVWKAGPGRSVLGAGHEFERQAGEVLEEVDAIAAEDAAAGFTEAVGRA